MKNLICTIILFCALTASAAQRITLTITVTNAAVTGNTLVVNSSSRFFTNANSVGTILTNLVGKNETTTNLYNQIASFPYAGPLTLQYAGTNSIKLIGTLGGVLAASSAGNWAVLTLSTQTAPATFTQLWPLENIPEPSNRIGQASAEVSGASAYSTNSFATNSTAMSNFITKGASPLQEVIAPVLFSGGLRGSDARLTNGFTLAVTNINQVSSNGVNFGNAFRSEGSGGNSLQLGSNAVASGSLAVAVGNGAVAAGANSVAVGTGALATNAYTLAIGTGARALTNNGVAIGNLAAATGDGGHAFGNSSEAAAGGTALGQEALATGVQSTALGNAASGGEYRATAAGYGANAGHSNSAAFGQFATTTRANQVRLGTVTETVSIPGSLEVSGTQSSTVFDGTNLFRHAVSFAATNVSSLANGANDLDPGLKVYVKVSGPSAAYSIDKIDRGYDGRILTIQKTDSYTMTVVNNSGAGVLGDAAKILTGTGGTLTITNNPGFVQLIYDGAAARWGVIGKSN